jgi:multidrug efflux pump subunit AcrB
MTARGRISIAVAGALLFGGGIIAAVLAGRALDEPPPARTRVVLTVRDPGRDAATIEKQIIRPLEATLRQAPWVRSLHTRVRQGLAELSFDLEDDAVNVYAWLEQQQRQLPASAELQTIQRVYRTRPVRYTLASTTLAAVRLREHHDWVLRPALLTVPGVAEVRACDGPAREIVVRVDPVRMVALGLSLNEVREPLSAMSLQVPAGQGAFTVRSGAFESVETLRNKLVAARTPPVRLSDIAAITEGSRPPSCVAIRDGLRVLAGEVLLRPLPTAAERVRLRLKELEPTLPPGVRLEVLESESVAEADIAVDEAVAPERGEQWAARVARGLRADGVAGSVLVESRQAHLRVSAFPASEALAKALGPLLVGMPARVVALDGPSLRTAAVWIRADDRGALRSAMAKVVAALRRMPAVVAAEAPAETRTEAVAVIDSTALARHGLSAPDVSSALEAATEGVIVLSVFERERRIPVRLRLGSGGASPTALGEALLRGADGRAVPLSAVASWRPDVAEDLERYDGRPALRVTAIVRRKAWERFLEDAPARLRDELPAGIDVAAGPL